MKYFNKYVNKNKLLLFSIILLISNFVILDISATGSRRYDTRANRNRTRQQELVYQDQQPMTYAQPAGDFGGQVVMQQPYMQPNVVEQVAPCTSNFSASNLGSGIREIQSEQQLQMALNNRKPTIIYWTASWCTACVSISNLLPQISSRYGNSVDIFKVNYDKFKSSAVRLGVESVPYTIFIRDGRRIDGRLGSRPDEYFISSVESLIQGTLMPEAPAIEEPQPVTKTKKRASRK